VWSCRNSSECPTVSREVEDQSSTQPGGLLARAKWTCPLHNVAVLFSLKSKPLVWCSRPGTLDACARDAVEQLQERRIAVIQTLLTLQVFHSSIYTTLLSLEMRDPSETSSVNDQYKSSTYRTRNPLGTCVYSPARHDQHVFQYVPDSV
jgi:hypothetical protein